jgi:streptomycin 6-kinase
VRRRASNLGAQGLAWLRDLDAEVAAIAAEWNITTGEVLRGGSEALVIEATTSDGREAVLKIGIPGSDSGGNEARVLALADGRGYARLYRHDGARRAMLLERLGPSLVTLGWSADEEIRIVSETLQAAWFRPPDTTGWMTGAEKAAGLGDFILELWEGLGRPVSERSIEQALSYAGSRAAAFSPATAVLAHGDPHLANTLHVPGSANQFKFVDPNGLFIEPAYDLGVVMRGWGAQLLAGDPFALGRQRAALLSRLTGVELEPIWEWGFIERISTGLLLRQLGSEAEASEYLDVAEAWAAGGE